MSNQQPIDDPQPFSQPVLEYSSLGVPARPSWFRWYVCFLLLFATTVNYMDRLTLSSAAPQIMKDFSLSHEDFGDIEFWFGLAFAAGSLVFGLIADLVSVRLLYPAVLLAWSFTGIATGWMHTFAGLLVCRTLLGWFEAAHWPCALTTTQRLLPPGERGMGNSVLQLGASVGAVITPLILALAFMITHDQGKWRIVFQAIGALGIVWAAFWFGAIRKSDLDKPPKDDPAKSDKDFQRAVDAPMLRGPAGHSDASGALVTSVPPPPVAGATAPAHGTILSYESAQTPAPATDSTLRFVRRFIVLSIVVVTISISWQMFRVWLVLFLREGRQYSQQFALSFTSAFYLAAGLGCVLAGVMSLVLQSTGLTHSFSRFLVFAGCCGLTALSVAAAFTPPGNLLLLELLLYGAGSLGLFPCYYALSQELSSRHLGKITGILGAFSWVATSPLHKYFGRYIDVHHSYNLGIAIVGCMPVVGLAAWWFIWDWPARRMWADKTEVVTIAA